MARLDKSSIHQKLGKRVVDIMERTLGSVRGMSIRMICLGGNEDLVCALVSDRRIGPR